MTPRFGIEVKLTHELTAAERLRLCSLFGEVFDRPFPEDLFLRKYGDAHGGHSFHCIATKDDIVGAFSAVRFRYSFFGRECVFASAIDLMLESKYRPNVGLMKRMSDDLYRRLADDGVAFVFSCVREEMLRFHQLVGGWRNIGKLSYYIAPIRGPHVPGAGAVLRTLLRGLNRVSGSARAATRMEAPIHKQDDHDFRNYRYSFFRTDYRRAKLPFGEAVYTGKMFWALPGAPKGLRLSLLVDVKPAAPEVLDAVVRHVVHNDPEIDYLIYPGLLPTQPRLCWKVSRRFERPQYYLAGRILRPDLIDDRVYQIGNWNINLADTDLV